MLRWALILTLSRPVCTLLHSVGEPCQVKSKSPIQPATLPFPRFEQGRPWQLMCRRRPLAPPDSKVLLILQFLRAYKPTLALRWEAILIRVLVRLKDNLRVQSRL